MMSFLKDRVAGRRRLRRVVRPRGAAGAAIGCESLEGRELMAYGWAFGFLQQVGGSIPLIQASEGTPAPTATTSTNARQQAEIKLQTDLHGLALKSQATVGQLTTLSDALQADVKDATGRATSATLAALRTDLQSLAQNATGNTVDVTKILADEAAVLTSAGVPTADITATQTAQQAVITASAITPTDLQTIYADQKAILSSSTGRRGFGFGFFSLFGQPQSTPNLDTVSGLLGVPLSFFSRLNGYHRTGGTTPSSTPYQTAQATLQADIHKLALQSNVTVAQETTLADDVRADAKAATRYPSYTTLNKLSTDLQAAIKNGGTLDVTGIQADESAILASAGVPAGADATVQPSIARTLADQLAIITASGITGDQLHTIYLDEQAVIAARPPHRGFFGR